MAVGGGSGVPVVFGVGWWRLALGSGGLWWYGSVVSGERLQFCVGDYLRMGSQPLCYIRSYY